MTVLGLWDSLLLDNRPKGLSCSPPPLLSAVGQTWKELNILHRERKANKMQTTKCKQNEKKKEEHRKPISELISILFIGHDMTLVFLSLLINNREQLL